MVDTVEQVRPQTATRRLSWALLRHVRGIRPFPPAGANRHCCRQVSTTWQSLSGWWTGEEPLITIPILAVSARASISSFESAALSQLRMPASYVLCKCKRQHPRRCVDTSGRAVVSYLTRRTAVDGAMVMKGNCVIVARRPPISSSHQSQFYKQRVPVGSQMPQRSTRYQVSMRSSSAPTTCAHKRVDDVATLCCCTTRRHEASITNVQPPTRSLASFAPQMRDATTGVDPSPEMFEAALQRVLEIGRKTGTPVGLHTFSTEEAAARE